MDAAIAPLLIAGGAVLTPEGLMVTDLLAVEGAIVAIGPLDPGALDDVRVLDASGMLVAPGLIDLQCNGGFVIDLGTEPERLWELSARLPATGVSAWLPTIVSTPTGVIDRAVAALAACPDGFAGAEPLGLHLEGPALNPQRRGAHPVGLLRLPTTDLIASWSRDAGVVLVTLAPELDGGIAAVRQLCARGVTVAAGHTDATTAEVLAAVDAGVTAITHLYNGMAPFAHREPGPIGVALADERVVAGVIVDGVHVHPVAVAAAFAALGPERLLLVTDAVAPMGLAGAPDAARLADGTLAGSTLTLDRAIANLVDFSGCSPVDAVACATSVPARLLGLANRGKLAVGSRADVVLLDEHLRAAATVVGGRVLHPSVP